VQISKRFFSGLISALKFGFLTACMVLNAAASERLIYPGDFIEAEGTINTAFGEEVLRTKEGLDLLLIGDFPRLTASKEYKIRGFYTLFTDGSGLFLHGILNEENGNSLLARELSWAIPEKEPLKIPEYTPEKLAREFLSQYRKYVKSMEKHSAPDVSEADTVRWRSFLKLHREFRQWRELYTELFKLFITGSPQTKPVENYYIQIVKKDYLLYLRRKADHSLIFAFPIAYGKNPDGLDKKELFDYRTPETPIHLRTPEKTPFYIAQRFEQPLSPEMTGKPLGIASKLQEHSFWSRNGLKIIIHGTPNFLSIGTKASNGCIRLFEKDSQILYDMTVKETPVIIE
jgi:hypothetical protein